MEHGFFKHSRSGRPSPGGAARAVSGVCAEACGLDRGSPRPAGHATSPGPQAEQIRSDMPSPVQTDSPGWPSAWAEPKVPCEERRLAHTSSPVGLEPKLRLP